MKKVLIPTKLDTVAAKILAEKGQYEVVQNTSSDLSELVAAHPDTYALIVRSEKITADIIASLPELKVVIRAGAGYNTIDIKYARKHGVDVMNTPGANANAVAEEVVALMLADARHIVDADASTRVGKWEKSSFMGREVTGKTVGVVGLGAIGRLVVKRLSGFDVKVLAYDPMLSEERARDYNVELVDLKTIFKLSDYVTLHIPENDETRGLISDELLGSMRENATLVNCARAGIIDEAALRRIKPVKNLRFLNDVYSKDAAGDKSVADIADIMLPHLGASTVEANRNAATRAAEQLIEYVNKGIVSYVVNRDVPEGLDEAYGDLAFSLTKICRQVLGQDVKLRMMETSIYGELQPFSDWLVVPMVTGLDNDFDVSMSQEAALSYLNDCGIEYMDREPDNRKGYSNSITIDLTGNVDTDTLKRVSVRGTIAEGTLMISRINDFDQLYLVPSDHMVLFCYQDRPGVIGRIGAAMAENGINIDDVRNPHDSKGHKSIAIFKVNTPVSAEIVQAVAKDIDASFACAVNL